MKFRSKARPSNFLNHSAGTTRIGFAWVDKLSVRAAKARHSRAGDQGFTMQGFTMIEMLVVISMMLVLLSIAMPMYTQSVTRAREAKLRQNLATLREVIEKYSLDRGHAPQSANDLVDAGYIKVLPDDITGSTETWQWGQESDPDKAWDPSQFGINDVHSGSNDTSSDGGPYSAW